jgi:polyisoprenoid-binding protein YceI
MVCVMKPTLVMLLLAGATIAAAAGTFPVSHADVRVMCPMTIGGTFAAKTTALNGSLTTVTNRSPVFDGSLTVDLRTLGTGISLRDEHLRETYLEVDKAPGYDKAILSEIDLQGLNPDAQEGKGSFTATLLLHGVKKTVTGSVDVHKAADGLTVKASFPVNLSDFNIAEPRYLGVGVKNTVHIEVTFTSTP